jgi:uncharacterized protein (DUF934 family)
MAPLAPPEILLDGAITAPSVAIHPTFEAGSTPPAGTAIPLSAWLAAREGGGPLDGVGVILEGDHNPAVVRDHLEDIPFIALHFPKFSDGRCYSHARRLRAMWGYGGDIYAFGDVLRDQLLYMKRVGINGFFLRADQSPQACLQAFGLYSAFYQYD